MDDQQWAARQWEKAALHEAQVAFDAALNRLARGGPRALRAFRTWAGDRLDDMCSEVPFLLREVVEALRPHVPINQHAPDELIVYPTTGEVIYAFVVILRRCCSCGGALVVFFLLWAHVYVPLLAAWQLCTLSGFKPGTCTIEVKVTQT